MKEKDLESLIDRFSATIEGRDSRGIINLKKVNSAIIDLDNAVNSEFDDINKISSLRSYVSYALQAYKLLYEAINEVDFCLHDQPDKIEMAKKLARDFIELNETVVREVGQDILAELS